LNFRIYYNLRKDVKYDNMGSPTIYRAFNKFDHFLAHIKVFITGYCGYENTI